MKSDKVRLLVNQSISRIYLRFMRFPTAAINCSESQLVSPHYVIICEHVFAGLEVFLSARGGQGHCYSQRMFSKDSERRKNKEQLRCRSRYNVTAYVVKCCVLCYIPFHSISIRFYHSSFI